MSTVPARKSMRSVERVPDSTSVMLANCGHSPHRDQPEAVLEAIAEFIELA